MRWKAARPNWSGGERRTSICLLLQGVISGSLAFGTGALCAPALGLLKLMCREGVDRQPLVAVHALNFIFFHANQGSDANASALGANSRKQERLSGLVCATGREGRRKQEKDGPVFCMCGTEQKRTLCACLPTDKVDVTRVLKRRSLRSGKVKGDGCQLWISLTGAFPGPAVSPSFFAG